MRRPADAKRVGQLRDAPGFANAAGSTDVGQQHVALAVQQAIAHSVAIALGLAHGDAQTRRAFRQARVAVALFGHERILKPLDVTQVLQEASKGQSVGQIERAVRVD